MQTIETFGDAADNFVLDYLEPSRTMIAWDAEVNGNREIFVQDDRFTDSPVQITSNISNDSEPLIIHHKVSSDSFNITVLWKSDRTGTARIWAATNRVPVAVDDEPNIPQDYQVSQNYPNPFNAQTYRIHNTTSRQCYH
ncbi:MAG: hypothetical protein MAGBODY4_01327 [Candidatus Marinimicrobia bacterium]|nr:hypothetical protein [Candidatus Neomarinimicrobiota bacterium]